MTMRSGEAAALALGLACMLSGPARAQQASPIPAEGSVRGEITDHSPALPDGARFVCYSIETRAGEPVTVTMRSRDLDSRLWIERGALCSTQGLQHDNNDFEPNNRDARVTFTSAGGRYLIVARPAAAGQTGRFDLTVEGGVPSPAAIAEVAPGEADRLALMNSQVQARRTQLAAEAEARARAEEQRRIAAEEAAERARQQRAEDEADSAAFWGGVLNAVQQVADDYVAETQAETARLAEQNARILAAQQQQRQQETDAAAEVQRARDSQQQQQNAALTRQLAEANAYRDRMLASGTLSSEMQERYRRENQQVLAEAQRMGIADQLQSQRADINAGRQPSATQGTADAQAQARADAEAQRRADEQRQIREAEARRLAEQQRQAEAARLAEQQRQATLEAQRRAEAEQARVRRQAENDRRMADTASGRFSTVGLPPLQPGPPSVGQGQMTQGIDHIGQCPASSITVSYNLNSLMGEATVNGVWSFQGEDGCTPPHNTAVWLRIEAGGAYGYVKLDPSVPAANRGFGINATGSPSWSQLVCGFRGSGPTGCMDAQSARSMWRNGQVVGFEVGW